MAAAEKSANAIGGRTARACDSCLRRRARWYCAADDAFLCQSCDASVHSANQLARRHDRVRLDTASSSSKCPDHLTNPKFADTTVPAWHHGFTRKARTPRSKKTEPKLPTIDLVPEISNEFDETELEEHFFFRVPEFDPFADVAAAGDDDHGGGEFIIAGGDSCDLDINQLFLPTELDLAEFAADVESLLGKVDDEEVKVKGEVEMEEGGDFLGFGMEAARGEADGEWGGMESRLPLLQEDEKKYITEEENCEVKKKKMLLRLNYEDVMAAWACQGSPWTTGVRPELGAGDTWPDCMATCGSDIHPSPYGEALGLIRAQSGDTKGREERVSRYREKRRTRMFSKKIRYQVRKLNAEKRPRMKGRFVKRSSSTSFPLNV